MTDIIAVIQMIKNASTAPRKPRADLVPCALDFVIDIVRDLVGVIDAFRSLPFPFAPGDGDCPPTPCE